jgi:hypothetical protein
MVQDFARGSLRPQRPALPRHGAGLARTRACPSVEDGRCDALIRRLVMARSRALLLARSAPSTAAASDASRFVRSGIDAASRISARILPRTRRRARVRACDRLVDDHHERSGDEHSLDGPGRVRDAQMSYPWKRSRGLVGKLDVRDNNHHARAGLEDRGCQGNPVHHRAGPRTYQEQLSRPLTSHSSVIAMTC